MFLDPDDDNVAKLLERQIDGPVTMLNLLRFRPVADYSNHPELEPATPITGEQAYEIYVDHTRPHLVATGGSISFLGDGGHFFIGPTNERWDFVMLIRQKSLDDFFSFATNEEYLAGLGHRSAALADSRLLPLVERVAELA